MSKVLVEIKLPAADRTYDVYIPLESRTGEVLQLLSLMLTDLADGKYKATENDILCDADTGRILDANKIIGELGIKNGSRLMLM
jgi:hypothetical protein